MPKVLLPWPSWELRSKNMCQFFKLVTQGHFYRHPFILQHAHQDNSHKDNAHLDNSDKDNSHKNNSHQDNSHQDHSHQKDATHASHESDERMCISIGGNCTDAHDHGDMMIITS